MPRSFIPSIRPRFLVALSALALTACNNASAPLTGPPPVEVGVYTVHTSRVPIKVEFAGRVAAFAAAEIRPQTGGIILQRLFTEGTEVKAGQVLYRIDPSEARAAVANAEATLASAQAALASAREKATRYRELVAIEAVSRESADEAEAAFKQSEAEVAAGRASLDSARLTLGYANVRSPISGRIGRSAVSQGALVSAAQTTALATVQQLDPIYVDATQSAAEMLRFRREFESGRLKFERGRGPVAHLVLEDGSAYAQAGQFLLAESVVEETSGSVTLRAQFPNPKRELLPGMYVRITFEGAVANEALTVPQVAVSRDAKGNALVFVVGADGKVEQRTVQAVEAVGDQWIVDKGLKTGERVIVEGVQKVRAGVTVKAVPAGAAATAASASAARPASAAGR